MNTSQALVPVEDRIGTINRISAVTYQMLVDRRIVRDEPRRSPVFYAWPRGNRLVLLLDPMQVSNPDAITNKRFCNHLSLALGRLPVVSIVNPVLAVQVGFSPTIEQVLISTELHMDRQPSPLHVPIGLSKRGPVWLSIVEMDSVLIGGMRRLGKTNLLHTWIQSLDHGNACECWIWDGKPNNTEFRGYAGRPNIELIRYDGLSERLAELGDMMNDRARVFGVAQVANITDYNRAMPEHLKLTPIVIIIDEAAEINHMPDADDNLTQLGRLISVGGAYGIYPVIATQKPTADAVRTIIKSNLKTRIAFPTANNSDSRLILDQGGAEHLDKTPGRLLLNSGSGLVECQTFVTRAPAVESGAVLPPETMQDMAKVEMLKPQEPPTSGELELAAKCKQNGGRFTEAWLRSIGYTQGNARAVQREWRAKDWVRPNESELGKPLCLTEYMHALLIDLEV